MKCKFCLKGIDRSLKEEGAIKVKSEETTLESWRTKVVRFILWDNEQAAIL